MKCCTVTAQFLRGLLTVAIMDPALVYLIKLVVYHLTRVPVWWHLPLVLTMTYTFYVQERLQNNALFDSYPSPLPQVKRRCNDPVLGDGYIGCFDDSMLYDYKFKEQPLLASISPEDCIAKCKTAMFSYAALQNGKRCYCGSKYEIKKNAYECKCRKKCKGNKTKRCGGQNHVSLYKTYICTKAMKTARTIDGTCNDLNTTAAGSRFYRFGRNVPLQYAYSKPNQLLKPNPRVIARELLQRKKFLQVPWLNLLAVAWIQFMAHDWFDHGTPVKENKIKIHLEKKDPLYAKMRRGVLEVDRTKPDKCWTKDDAVPPAYQNDVTHWWDGSQLYGSDEKTHARLRSLVDGKLIVDDDGFLPMDPKTKIDISGFTKNWWVGLSLLHNLFTREHNLICDMLLKKYPTWNDDKLFQTARLINAAQIVQIHAMEWTGAILNSDFIHESQRAQWNGTLSDRVKAILKQMNVTLGKNSIPTHRRNPPDYRGVPFSLTEEFISVYRMHSLLPDTIAVRRMKTGKPNGRKYSLPQYSFGNARKVFDKNNLGDVLYTFGVDKAGQLVLHNYPTALMDLKIPKGQAGGKGQVIDLATIDILRDRERGIPRYNQFRRLLNLTTPRTFEELTNDTVTAAELRKVYNNTIEDVDLLIGSLAEARPEGFGFGETPFHLFLCMANRRLKTDRFLTIDYKAEYYTQEGLHWVESSTMKKVLLRNFPEVKGLLNVMQKVENAFYVWNK